MANFGIIRIQKLKTATSVRASLKHALREQITPNADPEKLANNHIWTEASTVKDAIKNYNARLATQEKIRKNAVTCVEFLVTASPEAMKAKSALEQRAYFEGALRWIEKKHGKENVIFAAVHNDETTPHLTAFVVPIDQRGKLCCKSFYGGSKHTLSELQTEFTEKVANLHNLERGIRGSKAKHVSIKNYYARINTPVANFPIFLPKHVERQGGLLGFGKETSEELANRLNDAIKHALNRHGLPQKAQELENIRKENATLKSTLKRYQSVDSLAKLKESLPQYVTNNANLFIESYVRKVANAYHSQKNAERKAKTQSRKDDSWEIDR
jgi:hypothetical protein